MFDCLDRRQRAQERGRRFAEYRVSRNRRYLRWPRQPDRDARPAVYDQARPRKVVTRRLCRATIRARRRTARRRTKSGLTLNPDFGK